MMRRIYKYLPDDFPLEEHLKSPELKLSLVKTLNDPYEGQMTKNGLKVLSNVLIKHNKSLSDLKDIAGIEQAILAASHTITEVLNSTCVTSFSETQRNLLMWAHYASKHKGLCIGYDTDVLSDEDDNNKLVKVNYDSIIYDQDDLDEIESLTQFKAEETELFIERLFTTKSDDWSYEKEHRYVSSCESASRILIDHPYEELSVKAKFAISVAISKKTHEIIKHESSVEVFNLRTPDEISIAKGNSNELEFILASEPKILLMKKINKKKIKTIHLGVFFDKERERNIVDIIESDPDLKHIILYRNDISNERFELESHRVNQDNSR